MHPYLAASAKRRQVFINALAIIGRLAVTWSGWRNARSWCCTSSVAYAYTEVLKISVYHKHNW